MAENHFMIRHGEGAPSNDQLMPYELGFDNLNNILYIKSLDPSHITTLENTTWTINSNPNISSDFEYNINFNCQNNVTNYTTFKAQSQTGYDYKTAGTISTLANTEWWGISGPGVFSDSTNLLTRQMLDTTPSFYPGNSQAYTTASTPVYSSMSTTSTVIKTLSAGVYFEYTDFTVDSSYQMWVRSVTDGGWLKTTTIDGDFSSNRWVIMNFTSNSTSYTRIKFSGYYGLSDYKVYYENNSTSTLVFENDTWKNVNYRSIKITSYTSRYKSWVDGFLSSNRSYAYLQLNGNVAGFTFTKIVLSSDSLLAYNSSDVASNFWQNGNWSKFPISFSGGSDATSTDFITWMKSHALIRMENQTYHILKYDSEIYYTNKNYNKVWKGENDQIRKSNRIITITGGNDITNTNLITWLKANAICTRANAFDIITLSECQTAVYRKNGSTVSVSSATVTLGSISVPKGCYLLIGMVESGGTGASGVARCRVTVTGGWSSDVEVGSGYGTNFSKWANVAGIGLYSGDSNTVSISATVNGAVTIKNWYLRAIRLNGGFIQYAD